jgi:hypothetical protein
LSISGIAHLSDLVARLSPKRAPLRRERIGVAS